MTYLPGVRRFRYARINATTEGGENTVIAAPEAGIRIVVIGYSFSGNAEGTVTLKDSGATYSSLYIAKTGGISYTGGLEAPAFECAAAKALVLETSASLKAAGHLTYILAS